MKFKKKFLIPVISLTLVVLSCMVTSQSPDINSVTQEPADQHLNDTDKGYIEKILSGEIVPINEDKDLLLGSLNVIDAESGAIALKENKDDRSTSINFITAQVSKEDHNSDIELVDQDIIIDNRMISESKISTDYCMNIIVDNTFELNDQNSHNDTATPVLSKSDEDTEVNVTVGAKITYSKIKVGSKAAYKISKVYGKFVKSTDSQMTCSLLKQKTRAHAANRRYNASGTSYKPGNEDTGKTTIKKSPNKGTWYSISTGQKYFYRSDDTSYNVTNVYYTVKRTVSSFNKEYYIPLAFGNISHI